MTTTGIVDDPRPPLPDAAILADEGAAGYPALRLGVDEIKPHKVVGCAGCGQLLLSREHIDEKDADDRYGSGGGLPPLVRQTARPKIEGTPYKRERAYCRACWEASHTDRRPPWSAAAGGKYAMGG